MNYWKSFRISLLVFYIISTMSFSYAVIKRYMHDGYIGTMNYFIFIFLFLLGTGIASSLTAALLFKNKIASLTIVALAIIVIIVGRRMEMW